MLKPVSNTNEVVSLTVMLLLVVALIASQANATLSEVAQGATVFEQPQNHAVMNSPVKTTIKAHIIGQPLTISVDPMSGFGNVRFVFD